jgi:hypothetical protein
MCSNPYFDFSDSFTRNILTFSYCQICFFPCTNLFIFQKRFVHSENPIIVWSIWILLCLGVHLSCFCLTYQTSIDVNLELPVSYSPKFCGGFYDPTPSESFHFTPEVHGIKKWTENIPQQKNLSIRAQGCHL